MDINWDGIGAPPVGAVCEVRADHIREGDWTEVKVLALGLHEKDVAVLVAEHKSGVIGKMHCILYTEFEDHFRPIKTKEQIAAEERERSVEELAAIISGDRARIPYSALEAADRVLNAGYRKQEND